MKTQVEYMPSENKEKSNINDKSKLHYFCEEENRYSDTHIRRTNYLSGYIQQGRMTTTKFTDKS